MYAMPCATSAVQSCVIYMAMLGPVYSGLYGEMARIMVVTL